MLSLPPQGHQSLVILFQIVGRQFSDFKRPGSHFHHALLSIEGQMTYDSGIPWLEFQMYGSRKRLQEEATCIVVTGKRGINAYPPNGSFTGTISLCCFKLQSVLCFLLISTFSETATISFWPQAYEEALWLLLEWPTCLYFFPSSP